MKKNLPVIIVLVVLVLAGGYFLLGRTKTAVTLPGEIKKMEGESSESFTGKLKDAVMKGVPLKCEYKNADTVSSGFVKGKKYYGEMTSAQGQNGYVIMVDNCMWAWNKGENKGIKTCFEETEDGKDIWEMEGPATVEGQYSCKPAVFADTVFTPPPDVNFMDIDQDFNMMDYEE